MKYLLLTLLLFPSIAFGSTIKQATTTGLVGWWPMDEMRGTIANDFSVNTNTGIFTGSPIWVSGKRAGAVTVSSTNYFSVASSTSLWVTGSITISMWVKTSTLNSSLQNTFIGNENYLTSGAWLGDNGQYGSLIYFRQGPSGGNCAAGLNNGTQACAAINRSAVNDGKWHLLTGVRTSASGQTLLYLDGVLAASSASGGNFVNNSRGYDSTPANATIALDDIRIYNRALSAAEVLSLYKTGTALINHSADIKQTSGLAGYWSFNGFDVGSAINDVSGNGKNMYIWENVATSSSLVQGIVGQGFGGTSYASTSLATASRRNVTMAIWVKWDGTSSLNSLFYNGNAGANGYGINIGNGGCSVGRRIDIIIGGITCAATGSTNVLPINKWTHLAITGDSADLWTLYINGVATNTSTRTANTPAANQPTFVATASGIFKLDEARIYNRALSAVEIKQLYGQGASLINNSQNDRLRDGLTGMWSFNGPQLTTTTATDSAGSSNGTLSNTPTPIAGMVGQALNFNGTNQYITVPNGGYKVNGLSTMSVSMWVKFNNYNANFAPILFGDSNTGSPGDASGGWQIYYDNRSSPSCGKTASSRAIQFDVGTSASSYTAKYTTNSISDNKWHHIGATYNNGTVAIYVDGVSQSISNGTCNAGTGTIRDNSQSAYIGSIGGTSNYQNGGIDEVRIYNRALSAYEFKQLYLMGK